MRQFVKTLVGRTLVHTRLLTRMMGDAGIVVAFHRVNDENQDSLTCRVAEFERYCQFFRQQFNPIPLSEFVERMAQGCSLAGALAITFDDGYQDNFVNAAPVLKALGLPATFFVVSEFISTEHLAWWDHDADPKPSWMKWEEVAELVSMGFEIGGHTRTHVDLGEVAAEIARDEIRGAKAELEARIGTPVTLFAYPYGRAENLLDENRVEVQNAKYRCCASCYGGLVRPGDDPFRLNRVPISSWYRSPYQLAFEIGFDRA